VKRAFFGPFPLLASENTMEGRRSRFSNEAEAAVERAIYINTEMQFDAAK
jgi:hypothetical protein